MRFHILTIRARQQSFISHNRHTRRHRKHTPEKPQEPPQSRSKNPQKLPKSSMGPFSSQTSLEILSTHSLLTSTVFSSSLSTSLLPLLLSSSLNCCSLSLLLSVPYHILPQPTSLEMFFIHGFCALLQCLLLPQAMHPLSCIIFSLATFQRPFCAMNPPVSNSFHNPLRSFL